MRLPRSTNQRRFHPSSVFGPRFIIHPNSKYRRTWDMFTVIFVLYLTWIIPFDLAFDWWNMSPGVYVFGYILDAWFAVDILMNFRTGFTDSDGLEVTD